MKVTDLKENEVIHCETLEQYDAICQLLHEAGLRWCTGVSYLVNPYRIDITGEIVIHPYSGEYCSIKYAKEVGCIIHPATDFINPPQTKEVGIAFGLEQQGHIQHIQKRLNELGGFSYQAWNVIAKEIGWEPLTLACYYHEYLEQSKTQTKEEYAKERAIGFDLWKIEKGYRYLDGDPTNVYININDAEGDEVEYITTELYDEYLKSINHE